MPTKKIRNRLAALRTRRRADFEDEQRFFSTAVRPTPARTLMGRVLENTQLEGFGTRFDNRPGWLQRAPGPGPQLAEALSAMRSAPPGSPGKRRMWGIGRPGPSSGGKRAR